MRTCAFYNFTQTCNLSVLIPASLQHATGFSLIIHVIEIQLYIQNIFRKIHILWSQEIINTNLVLVFRVYAIKISSSVTTHYV